MCSGVIESTPWNVGRSSVMRVFEIRYRDAADVSLLVQPALTPHAVLQVNRALRTITVVDRPEVVKQVEEFIKRFPDFELAHGEEGVVWSVGQIRGPRALGADRQDCSKSACCQRPRMHATFLRGE